MAQLAKRSLTIPEDSGSNLVIGQLLLSNYLQLTVCRKDENKKRPGMAHFKKDQFKSTNGSRRPCHWSGKRDVSVPSMHLDVSREPDKTFFSKFGESFWGKIKITFRMDPIFLLYTVAIEALLVISSSRFKCHRT